MNTTTVTSTPRLSPEQVENYRREGYLVYKQDVFPPPKFQGLKDCFENLMVSLPPDKLPELSDMPHLTHPELFEWLFADELLDLVEPIIGPDIALFATGFISKPKGDGKRVLWHEDSAYWKTMIAPMEVVTIWLAIDPSTTENGCMFVIPHSHTGPRKGYSDYEPVDTAKNSFPTEIIERQRDTSNAVPCILDPNQASLHDARLMHGSAPNTSAIRRCGFTMRYMSTRCVLSEEWRDDHKIYLARGRDLASRMYGDPTRAYHDLHARRWGRGKKSH